MSPSSSSPVCPETDLDDARSLATSFRTDFLDNSHFLLYRACLSGSVHCVRVCVCARTRVHMHPTRVQSESLGSWVQESHIGENVAAPRSWQELLHDKYRMK